MIAVWGVQWDDLRFVLAVSRAGSALRAGELLGVNQTTVLRRLDALEAAVGAPLFERRRSGQVLTQAGRLVAEAAERMELEAQHLRSALNARERDLTGTVRVTTSEVLAMCLVTPGLRAFQKQYPGVVVELIASDRRLDIARGEADVALRASSHPQGGGIVARRMPDNDWTIYCSRVYAAERGLPETREAIKGHDIIGMEGPMAELDGWLWLAASAPEATIRCRSNSLITLMSNVKAGLGLGALPAMFGDCEAELVRCFAPPPELRAQMWLVVREAVKAQPHVRAFTGFLDAYIRATLPAATSG